MQKDEVLKLQQFSSKQDKKQKKKYKNCYFWQGNKKYRDIG